MCVGNFFDSTAQKLKWNWLKNCFPNRFPQILPLVWQKGIPASSPRNWLILAESRLFVFWFANTAGTETIAIFFLPVNLPTLNRKTRGISPDNNTKIIFNDRINYYNIVIHVLKYYLLWSLMTVFHTYSLISYSSHVDVNMKH